MTIDEAIKFCEETAHQNEILMKRYDDASGYSRSHNEKIRTDGAIGNENLMNLHRQLAEWLREVQKYSAILDELKDEITRAHNDLIESENEYGENARYTENDRGYLGGLLHAYEMFGREYEEESADE